MKKQRSTVTDTHHFASSRDYLHWSTHVPVAQHLVHTLAQHFLKPGVWTWHVPSKRYELQRASETLLRRRRRPAVGSSFIKSLRLKLFYISFEYGHYAPWPRCCEADASSHNGQQIYKAAWAPSVLSHPIPSSSPSILQSEPPLSFLHSAFRHRYATPDTSIGIMSFFPGSVYMLVDAQSQWRLFVGGNPSDTSNARYTSAGTLYDLGSDLKSRQKLGVQAMSLQPPLVLVLHLANLIPSLGNVNSFDNYIDKIVGSGDHGLPPRDQNYWWFDILYKLHDRGIVHTDAATLAQRIRSEAADALANYQRTGRCTFVNL